MTYWLPFIWMFGPPSLTLASALATARIERRALWLALVPLLWAVPLWGTLAITHGGRAHASYVAATSALLLGWALQLGLCVLVTFRTRLGWLARATFLFNLPATGMSLLGLGQGVAGVSM